MEPCKRFMQSGTGQLRSGETLFGKGIDTAEKAREMWFSYRRSRTPSYLLVFYLLVFLVGGNNASEMELSQAVVWGRRALACLSRNRRLLVLFPPSLPLQVLRKVMLPEDHSTDSACHVGGSLSNASAVRTKPAVQHPVTLKGYYGKLKCGLVY